MASFFVAPAYQPLDGNGKPYPLAKMYVYEAGTTNDLTVYQTNVPDTAHAQPIIADANGIFPQIYLTADVYKYVLKTSADAAIATYDNVASMVAGDGGTLPVASGGTGATTATAARTNLGAAAQSDYTTLNTTVGTIDTELSGIGGSLGAMAAAADVAVTDLATGMDAVLQRVFDTSQSSTSMNITDGTEYFTKNVTPKRDDSTITIRVSAVMNTGSSAVNGTVGVFRTGTTAALEAIYIRPNAISSFTILAQYIPSAVTQQTFSVRSTSALNDVQVEIVEHVAAPVT